MLFQTLKLQRIGGGVFESLQLGWGVGDQVVRWDGEIEYTYLLGQWASQMLCLLRRSPICSGYNTGRRVVHRLYSKVLRMIVRHLLVGQREPLKVYSGSWDIRSSYGRIWFRLSGCAESASVTSPVLLRANAGTRYLKQTVGAIVPTDLH